MHTVKSSRVCRRTFFARMRRARILIVRDRLSGGASSRGRSDCPLRKNVQRVPRPAIYTLPSLSRWRRSSGADRPVRLNRRRHQKGIGDGFAQSRDAAHHIIQTFRCCTRSRWWRLFASGSSSISCQRLGWRRERAYCAPAHPLKSARTPGEGGIEVRMPNLPPRLR